MCGYHAAVGATDPEEARLLLLLRQALVEGAVALELLAKTLVPLDGILDVEVDAPGVLLVGHAVPHLSTSSAAHHRWRLHRCP
jgi:hypothetical protein